MYTNIHFQLGRIQEKKVKEEETFPGQMIMAEDEIVPEFGGDNALDEKRASEVSQPSQAPSDSSSQENQSQARARDPKEDVILDACRRRDIDELQTLAESRGGFLTDELRQEACE